MGRLLAIDYGSKRVGLAISDPTKKIATKNKNIKKTFLLIYKKKFNLTRQS